MFLLDTNIIIYYLNGEQPAVTFLQDNRGSLAISFITWVEVLSFDFSEAEERIVRAFLQELKLIGVTKAILEQAVNLRRLKRIKLPDALIAATAASSKASLVTRNLKDFKGTGVELVNPFTHEA